MLYDSTLGKERQTTPITTVSII